MRNPTLARSVPAPSRSCQLYRITREFTAGRGRLFVKLVAKVSGSVCLISCTGEFTPELCPTPVTPAVESSAIKLLRGPTSARVRPQVWLLPVQERLRKEVTQKEFSKRTFQIQSRCHHFHRKSKKICSNWSRPRAGGNSVAEYKTFYPKPTRSVIEPHQSASRLCRHPLSSAAQPPLQWLKVEAHSSLSLSSRGCVWRIWSLCWGLRPGTRAGWRYTATPCQSGSAASSSRRSTMSSLTLMAISEY